MIFSLFHIYQHIPSSKSSTNFFGSDSSEELLNSLFFMINSIAVKAPHKIFKCVKGTQSWTGGRCRKHPCRTEIGGIDQCW